ncbi:pyridoxal phosphate-dependent aminotransferase [Sciscionella sediminilitoris]|uniref:pyridoxal phosphate-dependent aminotransferase n=1 Tax=Sciscionella sediminilitoris TaxID=1445613 RepID=UPI0004DF4AA6|nr:aminotransferase class I/II-fold pyridoxal phosphate-dependent enzyme [Sciscionella sp. SE31]
MTTFEPAAAVTRVARHSLRPNLAGASGNAVSLAIGEPDFDTPDVIVESAIEALRGAETHYANQNGLPELREAVAGALSRIAGDPFTADQVLITHGATAALAAAVLGIVDPGDRVVIPEPCYSLYPDLVRLAGGEPVPVAPAADFHWDLDALREAVRGARLVVFANPANPTGVVHREEELRALGEFLAGTGTLVLADEAYDAIVYPPNRFHSALSIESLRDRVVYAQTLSKTYAMTGWRVGYLGGPAEVVQAASRIHRTVNGSLNTAVQRAACTALANGPVLAEPMLAEYRERRTALCERLTEIPGLSANPPEGTFYLFARYAPGVSSVEFAARLRESGVLVRPGSEYGASGEGHVRFSFATGTDRIHLAMDRVAACLRDW